MVKAALQNLSFVAKASEISKDVWRYAKPDQWIFGLGKHWIYLYYFPQDKQDAESKGKSIWQSRIGKTDGVDKDGKIKYDAPEKRVGNQTRSYQQAPIIALLIRTDRHNGLEKAIQGILTVRGQDIPDAKGNSWFWTNPSEVVKVVFLVANISFDLLSPVVNLSAVLDDIERKII